MEEREQSLQTIKTVDIEEGLTLQDREQSNQRNIAVDVEDDLTFEEIEHSLQSQNLKWILLYKLILVYNI